MSKITHNYPQLSQFLAHTLLEAEQTRVGTDTEEDVWDEIRYSTLRETPPETTLFVGLYGDHHPACGEPFIDQRKHEIREHLEEDEVNLERVSFFHHTERAIKRHVPAQEAHEYTFIDHAVSLCLKLQPHPATTSCLSVMVVGKGIRPQRLKRKPLTSRKRKFCLCCTSGTYTTCSCWLQR